MYGLFQLRIQKDIFKNFQKSTVSRSHGFPNHVFRLYTTDSDIIYVKQYRTPVIVLNTVKAAEELLSKRGVNYSSRPRFVLFEVCV
jgi:hypothetical protein